MAEDVEEKYTTELLGLKINSKPMINSLTMMAEDFIQSAPIIVQVIEKHLARVRPEAKLPVLYLIDSIVKNIKKDYVELFSQNIVNTFCGVFEAVEDRTVRANLFKLRQTWMDVFPTKKLMTIDIRCSDLDEKWPIGVGLQAPVAGSTNSNTSIHVNPKFLSSGGLRSNNLLSSLSYDSSALSSDSTPTTDLEMKKQLILKQRQLIELQERKLELELLEKQFNMEEQARKKKQQEEEANAKLLAQAELAKQKTLAAASMMARASALPSPSPSAKETIESTPTSTTPVRSTLQTPETYQVPREAPEVVERISRNPDLVPSDPRIRRSVILQQHQPMSPQIRKMTPWNSNFDSSAKVLRNPEPASIHKEEIQGSTMSPSPKLRFSPPLGFVSISPIPSPPPAPTQKIVRIAHQRKSSDAQELKKPSEERSVQLITLSDSPPHKQSPATRSRSKSPKREATLIVMKNRSPSHSSSDEKRRVSEGKVSPQRFVFHSREEIASLSGKPSPARRSSSPKHFEKDRERKGSRASSKSSNSSRRSETESDKDVSISSSRSQDSRSPSSSSERFKNKVDKRKRESDMDREREKKFNRSSSSEKLSPPPTKKRLSNDNKERKSKESKFTDVDLRFDSISYSNNGVRREEKRAEKTLKQSKEKDKESKKSRASKQDQKLKSTPEKRGKNRNENRKSERDKEKRQSEREQFKSRTSAVLSRNYRKRSGIPEVEDEEEAKKTSDIDQRVDGGKIDKDVDLRKSSGQSGLSDSDKSDPPSAKKSRNSSLIDNLFGREDVDLRPSSSSCWSQVKKPNEDGGSRRVSVDVVSSTNSITTPTDDQSEGKQRPLPAVSPASSVGSSAASTCDALGRPLAFARLPDDPEERRRSLGTRSNSVDPVEIFRLRYIETPLRAKGMLDASDLEVALSRSKEELDQGTLNAGQFNVISKQLVQLNEGIKIREVQEMDKRSSGPGLMPSPWNPESNPVWKAGAPPVSVPPPAFPRPTPPIVNVLVRPQEPPIWARAGPIGVPVPRGPNPFIEAINPPPVPEILIPPANPRELSHLELDIDGTTPLDKIPRQVRFYGNTAIVFTGKFSDEPKEISFIPEEGLRTLFINGEPLKIRWGVTRKFYYNKQSHNIRIGAPTRELYIDGLGYEVYFGGIDARIRVDNNWVRFRLAGPPPGVKIGMNLRYDLVAGRCTIFVDGNPYSVYLDEKPQILDFAGFPVIAKFSEDFRSINLNGCQLPTMFGGPPRPVILPNGRRLYIRFNAISPIAEQNIMTYIRSRNLVQGPGAVRPREGFLPGFNPNSLPMFPPHPVQELPNSTNPLDMVANLLVPSSNAKDSGVLDNSYEVESEPTTGSKENVVKTTSEEDASSSGPLNVQDLLNKLLLAGLLPTATKSKEEESSVKVEQKQKETVVETVGEPTVSAEKKPEPVEVPMDVKVEPIPPPIPPAVEVVNVSFSDNLKKRRPAVVDSLYVGVQCGSCGLRFPTDQNFKYTQHLDWHFRQNRREKANARKALSRKWYYDLSDWIQFEEVEDLEDRATGLFEQQETDVDDDKAGGARLLDPDSYTVLATGLEGRTCPQCGEGFETFYDEEKEEWRLRDALQEAQSDVPAIGTNETRVFHPICHQDYLNSLVDEEEPKDAGAVVAQPSTPEDDDEVLILREGPKEVVLAELDIAEDDDAKVKDDTETDAKATETVDLSAGVGVEDSAVGAAPKPMNNASYVVLSPVVIDVVEDENSNIPGIAGLDGVEGSIFGFALNSNSSHGALTTPAGAEESNRIVYEAMKFDFPKIKEEPVEWKDISEDQIIMSNVFPHMSPGAEPMDITLDDEDSGLASSSVDASMVPQVTVHDIDLTDDDDAAAAAQRPVVAEIDGNLHFRATEAVKSAPAKIRINIFGLDTASQSPTHKSAATTDETTSSTPETLKPSTLSPTPDKSPQSPPPPDLDSLFKSDEIRRLKPKLAAAGKKLVNNPVKRTGKEESGLCSIM